MPASARCEPVFIDYGVSRLRVTVDTNDFQGKPVTVAGRQSVVEALARLTNMNHSLVQASDNISAADWILRCRNSDVFLLPTAGWKTAAGSDAIAPFGPPPQGARLEEWLQSSLLKIARAENLKRLAATTYDVGRGGLDVVLQLDLRLNNNSEPPGQPIEWGKEGLTLFNGDRVLCTIRNSGRFPIDVSVLYIDSGFGISSLFPENGEINRLQPGDKLSVPIEVTADTAGLEHLVVIAIKADGQPVDFSFLSQNTIDRARTRGGPTGMDSPVGKLFQHALFAEGTTRGLRRTAVSDHVMNRVTWNISAQSRPKSVSGTSK